VLGRINVKAFFEAGSPEQGFPDLPMVNYLDTQFDFSFSDSAWHLDSPDRARHAGTISTQA